MANLPGTIFRKVQLQPFSPPIWLPLGNFAQGIQGIQGVPGKDGRPGATGAPGVPQILYINVKDFGAAGNGSRDDTLAIQAALNAANGNSAGGVVVWFPPGIYICDTLLALNGTSVTLRAVNGSVVLKKKAGSTPSIIRILGNYCQVIDIQFDGSNVSLGNSCIECGGTFNKFIRCFMSNATGHGIDFDGTGSLGVGAAANNWVHQCYIHDNVGCGIAQNTATDNTFVENQIYHNGLEGISVDILAYRCKIIANWIANNCQSGGAGNISLDQGDLSIIQGNHILACAGGSHGIVTNNNISATNYCTIQGNVLTDNTGNGIYMKAGSGGNASFNTIMGNVVRGSGSNSIRLDTGCNSNIVVGNSLNGVATSNAGTSNQVANNT